jgi:hypothetical protein
VVNEHASILKRYVADGRSTAGPKQANDVEVKWDRRSGVKEKE